MDASADVDNVDVSFKAGAMLPGGEQELRLIFSTDCQAIVLDEVIAATIFAHGQAFQ